MAGPGDEIAAGAGGRGHLRASHADREHVIGILKAAFVKGRLAKDEFDLRVGQTLASRTYAELGAVTADLPAGLAAAKPGRRAQASRPPRWRPGFRRPGCSNCLSSNMRSGEQFRFGREPDGTPAAAWDWSDLD